MVSARLTDIGERKARTKALMNLTCRRLFPHSLPFLTLIDDVVPIAISHRYSFVNDEVFKKAASAGKLSMAQINQLIAIDNLEKSHLAALTALIRTRRWVDAVCVMADNQNFLGFVSSMRGLLESGGDILYGLKNVASTLAINRDQIALSLEGKKGDEALNWSALENELDHFVHAGWTGRKPRADPVFTAQPNVEYLALMECEIPGVVSLYHRLCAITHPSSASIDWLYQIDERDGQMVLSMSDERSRIESLRHEFPKALDGAVMFSCNPAFLILRVLHRFPLHPKIPPLRRYDPRVSKAGRDIELMLKSG